MATYQPLLIGQSSAMGATQGTSQQSSFGTSTSQATSGPVATPQSELSLILSQAAEQAGQGVLSWAQSMLAPDQAITNAAINHYFNTALTQEGLANTTAGQYYNQTMPQMTAMNNLAATYNSPSRQQFAAGQAEAEAVQGGYAGIQNAEQQLQGYGINPSAGVYQELSRAAQAGIGAQAASAGQQAATGVQNTGISLLQGAIAAGQQLPGQSVNSANAGTQAISGAQNAQLANTQTGAQAQATAQPFLQTASNLTPEQIASQSSSSSTNTSQGSSQESGVNVSSAQQWKPGAANGPIIGGTLLAGGGSVPAYARGGGLKIMHAKIPSLHPATIPHNPNAGPAFKFGHKKGGSRGGGAQGIPLGAGGGSTNPGNTSPTNAFLHSDEELRQAYGENSPQQGYSSGGGRGSGRPPQTLSSAGTTAPLPSDNPAPTDVGQTATPPAPTVPAEARGGGIPMMGAGGATTGGFVSRSLSPSNGARTDDIPARLNADEFVIPRDVTKYFGHKHFQDLILKARKAMGDPHQTPAKPSLKPPLQQNFAGGGGIPAPGAPTGDTASAMSPAVGQWGAQYHHPDASAPW